MSPTPLEQHLKTGGVTIMDGGVGSEIGKHMPEALDDDCWTGATQLSHPEVVEAVHLDYLNSGAQLIITNTYASNRHCLEIPGLGDKMEEANDVACKVAFRACDAFRKAKASSSCRCFVCGSISTHPPEFRAAVVKSNSFREEGSGWEKNEAASVETANPTADSWWPSPEQETRNFYDQAMVLKEGGCDCLALEMVKDLHHGEMILKGAGRSGLPVMIGITVVKSKEGTMHLRDDQSTPLHEQVEALLRMSPNTLAISVMHTPPEWVADGLAAVRKVWPGVLGAYPNNGDASSWPEWNEGDLTPERFAELAREWRRQGATIIGGCCGIGPAHIRALKADVDQAQPVSKL